MLLARQLMHQNNIDAKKDGREFSATTEAELLGLVAMWEVRGDDWKTKPGEPDVYDELYPSSITYDLEGNVIEPYARIGNNVVLWGGNHIAHHCIIGDHCFLSSQVGIAGATRIGERCFLGGKVGITEGLTIGEGCLLSAAVIVTEDVPPNSVVVRASRDRIAPFSSSRARGLML